MLNLNGNRELAYVTHIDEIRPIPNYDRVEYARVGGWWVIVRKDQFKVGDLAIYIEVDSRVPSNIPAFEFLEKRDFKVKTLKMCKVVSQGLLMEPADFGWTLNEPAQFCGGVETINANGDTLAEGDFLTERLGITYADPEDNKRKANTEDKYQKMKHRHPRVFKSKFGKWMMKSQLGRDIMFFFFGKKKDKKHSFPYWVVKTDEERCQNMPFLFPGDPHTHWYATEKIDGTSTTFTMKRKKFSKPEFLVCSRNVVFDIPNKACYYETNVYLEMAEKYDVKSILTDILKNDVSLDFVTLQGETYGKDIQKRDYGMDHHDFMAFNLIFGYKDGTVVRLNPEKMTDFLVKYNIPTVPIVDKEFVIPSTCDELLQIATGKSAVDGGMREGLVFRSKDGARSFKAVSNEFLLKYHQ